MYIRNDDIHMTRTKTCILDAYRGLASVRSFHLRAASAPLASLTVSKYFIMIDVNLYEIQRTDARPRAEWSKWSRSVSEGEMREATRDPERSGANGAEASAKAKCAKRREID